MNNHIMMAFHESMMKLKKHARGTSLGFSTMVLLSFLYLLYIVKQTTSLERQLEQLEINQRNNIVSAC